MILIGHLDLRGAPDFENDVPKAIGTKLLFDHNTIVASQISLALFDNF